MRKIGLLFPSTNMLQFVVANKSHSATTSFAFCAPVC